MLTSDKISDVMKRNLVGFASDGASTMMGPKSGLGTRLQEFVSKPLFKNHCMAHRLHLATRKFFDNIEQEEMKHFEKIINELYTFYSRSAKKTGSLRNTATALDVQFYRLNYIHNIRWIASEHRALKRVWSNWETLVTNLGDISHDSSDFDKDSRIKANWLLKTLKNPRFVTTLVFLIDAIDVLQVFSKSLQEKVGVVAGVELERDALIRSVEKCETENGIFMTDFLREAKCYSDSEARWKKCSNDLLSEKNCKITYKQIVDEHETISTRNPAEKLLSIKELRKSFAEKVSAEIKSYFPDGPFRMFEPFVPRKIPVDQCEIITYGLDEIQQMAAFYKLDPIATSEEWGKLLKSMSEISDQTCRLKNVERTTDFWAHFLQDSSLPWKDNIKFLGTYITCL